MNGMTRVPWTPEIAARVLPRETAHATAYRQMAAEATDPTQADALTRIAESHERIAARAAREV